MQKIDLFPVSRKELRRVRPILTALGTVGNQGNPSLGLVRIFLKTSVIFDLFATFKNHIVSVHTGKCFLRIIQLSGDPFTHG